jgi:hypothetical protein
MDVAPLGLILARHVKPEHLKLEQSPRQLRFQVLRFYVPCKDQPQRGDIHTARGNAPGDKVKKGFSPERAA